MNLKTLLLLVGTSALLLSCNQKADTPQDTTPKTLQDSISYALGYDIGRSSIKPMIDDSIAMNSDMLALGLKHSTSGDSTAALFATDRIDSLLTTFQMQMQAKQEQKMQEKQRKYEERTKTATEDAKKFLADNKSKTGIVSEKPNVQYRVITEGNGAKPQANDMVKFHLVTKYTDGEEIQSSRNMQPLELPLGVGTPDMQALFKKMPVGSKWEIFWPAKLAYGEENIRGFIPAEAVIVWEVELLEAKPQEAPPPPRMPN